MPVMRAAAENRRRKRVHAHIFVSPGLYGDAQICVIRPLWVNLINYIKFSILITTSELKTIISCPYLSTQIRGARDSLLCT